MHCVGGMRTLLPLAIAASILSTAAFASTATVNAGDARKPIAENIYNGYGDEMHQAQLAAAYSIDLPVGELARVALLGTFGQQSVAGIFTEIPMPPPQGAAIAL